MVRLGILLSIYFYLSIYLSKKACLLVLTLLEARISTQLLVSAICILALAYYHS